MALANKKIKHVARLLIVDDMYKDTLSDYIVIKFEVEIDGNDVVFDI